MFLQMPVLSASIHCCPRRRHVKLFELRIEGKALVVYLDELLLLYQFGLFGRDDFIAALDFLGGSGR